MRTLVLIAIGLAVLALFVAVAHLVNRSRPGRAIDGAWVFIWGWLVAALANSAFGYFRAGFPLLTEIVAFLSVFVPPALVAWLVSRRISRPKA
jgi:hypothetical protein